MIDVYAIRKRGTNEYAGIGRNMGFVTPENNKAKFVRLWRTRSAVKAIISRYSKDGLYYKKRWDKTEVELVCFVLIQSYATVEVIT